MPETPLVLGLDLGTSALKAVLMDERGQLLAQGSADIPTRSLAPKQAEQDPADWVAAAGQAMGALWASPQAQAGWSARVAAVGLAGQLPTLVMLGDEGPVGPAITWKDARADELARAVIGTQRAELYRLTGMPIDGRYLAPMYRAHRPAKARVRRILGAKDYLCRALTGEEVTDPSTAAGYGLYALESGQFAASLCSLWDIEPGLLPPVRPAHSMAAPLSAEGARLLGAPWGIAVTVGAADSMSGAYAMGSLVPGRACIAMGSSTIILDALREPRLDGAARYLLSPHAQAGWYAREMDLLATGTGYQWLCNLLETRPAALEREAAAVAPGAGGVSFMPYLAGGEQGALWNPALRGAIAGLGLASGRAELARAFFEGVGFEIRRCLEVLADTSPVNEIVIAGGFANSPFGLKLLASILNRPVRPYPEVSAAALGAALGALEAIGRGVPAPESAGEAVHPDESQPHYDALYARYLEVSAAGA